MLLALPDGTNVLIRPIAPEDKPLLVEGLRRLSPEAAFRRFLSPKVSFSAAELRYLTEVDGHDHVALIAVRLDDPNRLVAVARYVRLREPPYSDEELRGWAEKIRTQDVPTYVYLRHEDEPTAPAYADRLRELVGGSGA